MKRTIMTLMSAVTVLAVWASTPLTEKYAPRLTTPRMYEAFRTTGKIKIDGRLNEGDWTKARQSEPFTDIRGADYPEPVKDTYVKMMWDDENLYIGARLQEDNIIAKLSQRDTIIYHDNDFEVFLDPDGDAQNYFEIENNARGVVFDLLLDKPYRSGGSFFVPWNCEGLQLAVSHDGTLNKPGDKDRAWYVEMAIPFDALRRDFTDPRSLKVWRINFSRVQWLVPGQPEENWVWSPTGKVDMHMPERWGFLHFADAPVGSAAAAADYKHRHGRLSPALEPFLRTAGTQVAESGIFPWHRTERRRHGPPACRRRDLRRCVQFGIRDCNQRAFTQRDLFRQS